MLAQAGGVKQRTKISPREILINSLMHVESFPERTPALDVGFTQIAGLVARRILAFVSEGDSVAAGERIGLIRFGSRVDVYLPAGTGPRLLLGQRAIAGETVIAEIGVDPGLAGVSQ